MTWLRLRSVNIHIELQSKGVFVVTPKNARNLPEGLTDNSFVLGDRTLIFFHPDAAHRSSTIYKNPKPEIIDSINGFLEKLLQNNKKITSYIKVKEHQPSSPRDSQKAEKAKALGQTWGRRESPYVFSYRKNPYESKTGAKNYHTEVFLPIVYNDPKDDARKLGCYVFPWSSNNDKFKFRSIKKYVVAGCLGGTLTGYDQNEGEHLLIKHDLGFFNDQQIIEVSDSADSPYDVVLFNEFEKMAALIVNLGESREVLYHMPYYDYALFGIKLHMQSRMPMQALRQFLECIFERKQQHIQKVTEIAASYGITLNIVSPFELIFDNSVNHINTAADFVHNILDVLSPILPSYQCAARNVEEKEEKAAERALIDFCLDKLSAMQAGLHSDAREVWQDFLGLVSTDNVQDIEDLFKIANAVVVGMATKGEQENEVCSMLSLAEKPIQVEYARYTNDFQKLKGKGTSSKYPHALNLTILDTVASYCPGKKSKSGLLFYNHFQEDTLVGLMSSEFLSSLSANVAAFAEGLDDAKALKIPPDIINSPKVSDLLGSSPSPSSPSRFGQAVGAERHRGLSASPKQSTTPSPPCPSGKGLLIGGVGC